MAWFRDWLDQVAPDARPVVPIGSGGGGAFAGGLILADPGRDADAGVLCATLHSEDELFWRKFSSVP